MIETHETEEVKKIKTFDFRRFFLKLLRSYVQTGILLILFIAGAYFYLKYTFPLYQVVAYLQIQTAPNASSMIGGTPFSTNTAASQDSYTDLNGEVFKLQSSNLLAEVVDSMDLNLEIIRRTNGDRSSMLIEELPVTIDIKKPAAEKTTGEYEVNLSSSGVLIERENEKFTANYGVPFQLGGYEVTIKLKDEAAAFMAEKYSLKILNSSDLISKYAGRLTVSPVSKGGPGMLQVIIRDEVPERARRIIEVLKYKYDFANYLFKNRALQSEMEFLDKRLAAVNDELETQENYVKNFKANNQIQDVSTSANQLLGNLTSIDSKKNENDYKASLLGMIENNINANDGDRRINVNGLDDADLSSLVNKYNDVVTQKIDLLASAAPKDLRIPQLDLKIQETKKAIRSRVNSLKKELDASNDFLQKQQQSTSGRFAALPAKEKDYIQVNRLLSIKQSLFVFLLQKKEDKNIEFASSGLAGSRTVDWKISHVQNPKPTMLYGGAAMLALLVSALIVFLKMLLNKTIETSKEIYQGTTLHVIGELANAGKNEEGIVVMKDETSPITEQFRTLRTNLFYLTQELPSKVCLITSAISGEGKSFVALNLASAISISSKKTIILEFDLRYPGILQQEDNSKKLGLSDFLTEDINVETVINPVPDMPNLYIISAGTTLPQNAGEIILYDKMKYLFEYLRKKFDFIIVDTPPVEAVSDALTIGQWADLTLFVIRHKYSSRRSIDLINKMDEDSKLPRPVIVVNGIQPGGEFQNVHGYGYGYSSAGKYGRKKHRKTGHLKIA